MSDELLLIFFVAGLVAIVAIYWIATRSKP
jgi:hypothetical protein